MGHKSPDVASLLTQKLVVGWSVVECVLRVGLASHMAVPLATFSCLVTAYSSQVLHHTWCDDDFAKVNVQNLA